MEKLNLKKDKTASTSLVTVSDLQKLKMDEAIIIRLRMNPFKTKYIPNFKMNWGEEYPESTYPERKIRNIELFDLKKYVTEEKRKKMMARGNNGMMPNMLGLSNMPSGSPFSGMSLSSPFSGMPSMLNSETSANPFAMNNDIPKTTPPVNSFNSGFGGMDIDAMMKDIDEKLKELDEEEKRQKEKLKE